MKKHTILYLVLTITTVMADPEPVTFHIDTRSKIELPISEDKKEAKYRFENNNLYVDVFKTMNFRRPPVNLQHKGIHKTTQLGQ